MSIDRPTRLNWCLEKHRQAITILPITFPDGFNDLLDAKKLQRAKKGANRKTWLDWDAITPRFERPYFVEGAETAIQGLERSKVSRSPNLIMEYGFDAPIVLIETPVFIEFWDEFASSAEGGAVVVTKDENLVMEFSDDASYTLLSNFEIPD